MKRLPSTTGFTPGQARAGDRCSALLACAFTLVFFAMEARAETTLYVGQHFEVREHGAPVKYVFNGDARAARITGSLSTNTRIQRFRLRAGWNLLSLAVSATNFVDQLQRPGVIVSARAWNPQTANYSPAPQSASAGTVLWVHATTNLTLSVGGAYADPVHRQISAGATYLASPGLEAWTPSFPSSVAAWSFDAQPATSNPPPAWHARLAGDLASINDLPDTFPPGQAFYVLSPAPFELEIPDPALRVRYYHQDHLGSSAVMTDAHGALVEETAFYPFGSPRHQHRVLPIQEPYQFTQKERDAESGLDYFEARYLAGGMSRFLSVDPKYANTDASAGDPQAMNLYAYARSNPLRFTDPTGLDPVPDLATIAHNAAVSDTRAAAKSDGASFSAGFGDAVLDMFTPNPYIYEGLMGGSRLGPDIRRAIGIENVDSDSGYYTAGDVAGTLFTFATGAGEVKTAIKGGTTAVNTLSKSASAGGGVAARTALTLETGGTSLGGASRGAASAASSSANGIIRGGAARTAGGEVAGGGGVFARTGENAALAQTQATSGTAAALSDARAMQDWYRGMVDATRTGREAMWRHQTWAQRADSLSVIERFAHTLFFGPK